MWWKWFFKKDFFFFLKHHKSKLKQIDLRGEVKPFNFDIVFKFWEMQLHDSDLQTTKTYFPCRPWFQIFLHVIDGAAFTKRAVQYRLPHISTAGFTSPVIKQVQMFKSVTPLLQRVMSLHVSRHLINVHWLKKRIKPPDLRIHQISDNVWPRVV